MTEDLIARRHNSSAHFNGYPLARRVTGEDFTTAADALEAQKAEIARLTTALQDAEMNINLKADAIDRWTNTSAGQDQEIASLTRERDEARAEVAAAYEAAATCQFGWWFGFDLGTGEPDGTYCSVDPDDGSEYFICSKAIRTLTPADAKAALDKLLRQARIEAMREAAEIAYNSGDPDLAGRASTTTACRDAILARATEIEKGERE